jgi:hypothetical protein
MRREKRLPRLGEFERSWLMGAMREMLRGILSLLKAGRNL